MFQEGRRTDKMTARSKRRGLVGVIERPQRTDHLIMEEQLSPLLGKMIFPTFFSLWNGRRCRKIDVYTGDTW